MMRIMVWTLLQMLLPIVKSQSHPGGGVPARCCEKPDTDTRRSRSSTSVSSKAESPSTIENLMTRKTSAVFKEAAFKQKAGLMKQLKASFKGSRSLSLISKVAVAIDSVPNVLLPLQATQARIAQVGCSLFWEGNSKAGRQQQ